MHPSRWTAAGLGLIVLGIGVSAPVSGQETTERLRKISPIEINADELEYRKEDDRYQAKGSVQITQDDLSLIADEAVLDRKSGRVKAKGGVVMTEPDRRITADAVDYELGGNRGVLTNGTIQSVPQNLTLQGTRLERLDKDRYRIENGLVTTCDVSPGSKPLWRFRASRAEMKREGYLTARHVVFEVKGVPILYLPYLLLPVMTQRQSGLLVPHFGYSRTEGTLYKQDLFWAISDNQDATVSLDYRARTGIGGGLEYRYKLSRESSGKLDLRYFETRGVDSQRLDIGFRGVQEIRRDMEVRADVRHVNDRNLFRELSSVTDERVRPSLESNLFVTQRMSGQEIYGLARYTQDLQTTNDQTLQRLPEIGYYAFSRRVGSLPAYLDIFASATNFWREEEKLDAVRPLVRGQRVDLYPTVWGTATLSGITLTPQVGFRETWYSDTLSVENGVPVKRGGDHRDLLELKVGADSRFARSFSAAGPNPSRITHQVHPSLLYFYRSDEDQSNLPKFDQIDELPAQNRVIYGLGNRVYVRSPSAESGAKEKEGISREAATLRISHGYDFDRRDDRPFSNLRAELDLKPVRQASLAIDTYYNLYEDVTVAFNSDVKLEPMSWLQLDLGQRYTRAGRVSPAVDPLQPESQAAEAFWYSKVEPAIRFLTGGARLSLPYGISLAAQYFYDVQDRIFIEQRYGIRFLETCWEAMVSYTRLPDRDEIGFLISLRAADKSSAPATDRLFSF